MIEENIQAMTELAQAHGIKVVLCSVTPISDYERQPQEAMQKRPPADILKMNEWAERLRREGARRLRGLFLRAG